ncbi:uncharacterized protein LOC134696658 [Mytilus trossulus]|uniref:uncharacterized protein LOC134696658 n=1 Tax=Mytilus trossulus TaxID=6551 RepID=UPI0030050A7E
MDTQVSFQNDIVDPKSNLPMPHLSFIINFLLPKRLVGRKRTERQLEYFKNVVDGDPDVDKEFFKLILVGSVAEGYNIPDVMLRSNPFKVETHADADILLEIPAMLISVDGSEEIQKLRLVVHDIHPGYARIEVTKPKEDDDSFVFLDKENKFYLSGSKMRSKILASLPADLEPHGPAISTPVPTASAWQDIMKQIKTDKMSELHSHDYVYALPCNKWPDCAKLWIDRQERGDWLDNKTINQVVELGVHVVAVPHRKSELPDLEWRISFAVTERYLAQKIITDEQRQCYVFLKIIHFQTLKKLDLLSSYHLKTVFLHSCEKLPINAWVENCGGCLLFMIDMLVECLNRKTLPNFFISENNLIDHFTEEQAKEVLDVLKSIRENPLHPVLQFTDSKVMGLQSLSTPFRELVSPVLEDAVDFLVHRNLQQSVTAGFLSALFKMVYVLVIERKPEEAVLYIIDVYPIINKFSPGAISVAQIVDSIGMNFVSDIQLTVNLLEEVLKFSDEHPDVLLLRGNLACMFHALAYQHQPDTDEHMLALVQAETLFNTVVDVEDIYSATAVDFSCLLIRQGRFDEAAEKLDRFIAEELKHPRSTHCFYKKEITVLDQTLQKEANVHGKLSVNSLSVAYYLLVKCIIKDDLTSADPEVYHKILQYFSRHCHLINESSSFSLLGYTNILVEDWQAACTAFEMAMETCDGSVRLVKDNIAFCKTKLQHSKDN